MRLTDDELAVLDGLCLDDESRSDVLRRLIEQEANAHGMALPPRVAPTRSAGQEPTVRLSLPALCRMKVVPYDQDAGRAIVEKVGGERTVRLRSPVHCRRKLGLYDQYEGRMLDEVAGTAQRRPLDEWDRAWTSAVECGLTDAVTDDEST